MSHIGGGSAFFVRPLIMRLSLLTYLFVAMIAPGCGQSKAPEKAVADKDHGFVKDFFPDGSPKSVTKLSPDGRLIYTLYYSNGVPNHKDYFDDKKRVRETLLLRADGTAQTNREFDQNGKLVSEEPLDATGSTIKKTP
jgi:antitoxin component YwqK of YwqJK toxin-antitoxin module